jgi:RNA polymerase-binding transcription factor DksA
MNKKQLAHFRKILETVKKELGEDIDRTVHTMQDEATVQLARADTDFDRMPGITRYVPR